MDFAKKQLQKYGWTEGKGLGKNENGISEALKPKLKFDNTGVGHDPSEQFTFNWWENVFNNAADNINVSKSKDGKVKIDLKSKESVNITTKKYIIKDKHNKGLEYGSFLKTSKLTNEGVFEHEEKTPCIAEDIVLKTVNLTDEELFAACGGRTAHKGARHGLKLQGKLSRIEQQEKELEKLFINNSKREDINKKMVEKTEEIFNEFKKVDKPKKKNKETDENLEIESDSALEIKKKKKRKRKREKSDEENEIELQAAQKRYENFCDRKFNKKLKRRRKKEEKQFSKIADMFENCTLEKEKSDDDGFDEKISKKKSKSEEKISYNSKNIKKKSKKKKNRLNMPDDPGFCEFMNEVTEKLTESKELRKKLRLEKKKYDDDKVSKISEVLDRVCKV